MQFWSQSLKHPPFQMLVSTHGPHNIYYVKSFLWITQACFYINQPLSSVAASCR